MDTLITHGRILSPGGVLEDGSIWLSAGKIVAVGRTASGKALEGAEVLDAGGRLVAPGWIDAHTHGGRGYDFLACTEAQLRELLAWLPSSGVTAVLPTLAACPFEEGLAAIKVLAEAAHLPSPGAVIAGIHLEGPYLNLARRGAQPVEAIRPPNLAEMGAMIEAGGGLVRLVTLAPEIRGAMELARWLVGAGITVSAGHSDATYEQALAGFQAGVSRVSHLFNGMSPFAHRGPGLPGAALVREGVSVELVLDGIHVHPAAARLALKAKGLGEITLVTDACQAAGLGDGVYLRPGNRRITVQDGAARLDSGTLAGSILTMERAVANAQAFLGLSLDQAARLPGQNAAESLGLRERGRLAPGCAADVIVLEDNAQIQAAFVAGKKVFEKNC